MSNYYCPFCYQPTPYSSIKPIFCSQCGKAYSDKPSDKPKVLAETIRVDSPDVPEVQDDEPQAPLPKINGLDVEIETGVTNGIKFEDLVATASAPTREKKKGQKVNRKKFLEEFKKEAGLLRPNK
jgi:hypothetical protein